VLRQTNAHALLSASVVTCAMLVAPAQESVGVGRCGPGETVTPKEQGDGGHEQLQSRNPRYQFHSADVLELTFPFTPEFKQTVTVQTDGSSACTAWTAFSHKAKRCLRYLTLCEGLTGRFCMSRCSTLS